ncbi:MAG: hypothetical protein V1708_06385 [Candidatus Micrarchaeota archaeon]
MSRVFVFGLFALLLAAGGVMATSSPVDMTAAVYQIAPFTKVNADYSVTIDVAKARASGISEATIAFAQKFVAYQNAEIKALKNNKTIAVPQDIEAFYNHVKGTGEINRQGQGQGAITSLVCGGDQQHPHYCPSRPLSHIYRNTQAEMASYLRTAQGFHGTNWPGCGQGGYTCANDFTKWVWAYNCVWGSFRTQAYTIPDLGHWTYWTQTPEPNPEIFSYPWPVWWWGTYVQWWHGQC